MELDRRSEVVESRGWGPFPYGRGSVLTALMFSMLLSCRSVSSSTAPSEILTESWKAYTARFIQQDGRVIDRKAGGISTSEGQAYAMLRAVWMNDRSTFDITYTWAVNNLNSGIRTDHLWAWKWGKDPQGKWRVLDRAFASDADQDAALALILASRVWNEPKYLASARAAVADLWNHGTIEAGNRRYLLAGDTLCKGSECKINPSYYAPYAYRIFAQYDKNWKELADTSYWLLTEVSRLTRTQLPPDWVILNTSTGTLKLGTAKDSSFSYDAFRTYWRIALDAELNKDPRAETWLKETLAWVIQEWPKRNKLAAVIASSGEPRAAYESPEMLAGLMPALRLVAPEIADAMHRKIQSTYSQGAWSDKDSYYLQNWAWFGTALYQRYLGPFVGRASAGAGLSLVN